MRSLPSSVVDSAGARAGHGRLPAWRLMLRSILVVGVLAFGPPGAATAATPCASLIVDLYGQVALAEKASVPPDRRWPANLFQCVPTRSALWFGEQAGATLYFPGSGMAYEAKGPGRFQVSADQLQALGDTAKPQFRRMLDEFRQVRLDRADLTPGGIRMRARNEDEGSPKAVFPRGILVSEEPLRFAWRAGASTPPFQLRIVRRDLGTLYEATVQGDVFDLPESVTIRPGESLLWHVEGGSPTGVRSSERVEFVLATPAARALAQRLDQLLPQPSPADIRLREVLLRQVMEMEK